ncbi:uncharacterized protein LAESUDRAFT_132665 [Laetiporus sulphureus 93-53]|uniref:Uncharacterized protein n=1 Tax=Laetiporus sulphureus 93-53 TaxID=1314785 RepID=A0A165EI69_9APHY|nr:uncharacterized protein LAESUDRAFT_132665 [Laetiporus sulphureus 93-53]KZT07099.1 hypothetical protein LAESUDRAFT_132665 [Laetiporus sulphureus 93-53]
MHSRSQDRSLLGFHRTGTLSCRFFSCQGTFHILGRCSSACLDEQKAHVVKPGSIDPPHFTFSRTSAQCAMELRLLCVYWHLLRAPTALMVHVHSLSIIFQARARGSLWSSGMCPSSVDPRQGSLYDSGYAIYHFFVLWSRLVHVVYLLVE